MKKQTPHKPLPKSVKWLWGIVFAPFALLLLLLLLTAAGLFGRLPSFEELENPKSNLATEILSSDGKVLGTFFVQNRSYVQYDELFPLDSAQLLRLDGYDVPPIIADLISTEDVRYRGHSGIDLISLVRVGVKTVLMQNTSQGGGSTITQQLAKNLFPRDINENRGKIARTTKLVVSKLKEWITALKLEYNYTKEEIAAMYLNTVEFGSNAYGIKSAAHTFFNKEPHELNIQEAALLAGLVKGPTMYSPRRNPENALARRNLVLDRMASAGAITRYQRDSIAALPILLNYKPVSHNEGPATYFREMVRNVLNMPRPTKKQYGRDYEAELARWESNPVYGWCRKNFKSDGTPYDIYRDGLKIYTTLSYDMQEYAEEALCQQLAAIQPRMDAQVKRTGRLFIKTSNEAAERIIQNAMRYTDRYRSLVKQGASREEIEEDFRTPVRMRIFTYKGEVDTLMTPRDSILHHKQIMRGSFMAMNPNTGHVKAYVGGPDFKYFKYDMVKQGKRHIGSTIKPFVYCFAIDYMGMTPCTMVPNLPVTLETENMEPWQPKEAGRVEYDGVLHTLRWGLARSRNNYSAWIMKQAKDPKAVADFIHQMGIHSYIVPVNSLALGTADVSLFEMVGAYSTFVNKGVFTEPIFITRIEDRQGNVIASFVPAVSDAISEQTAYTMVQMLQNNVIAGTGVRLRNVYGFRDVEVGGKTGTSQENRDAWFMGVTPNLVAGVWIGCEDQSAHLVTGGEGASLALPVFGEFMKRVYADPSLGVRRTDRFYRPPGAIEYRCPDSAEGTGYSGDDEFFD